MVFENVNALLDEACRMLRHISLSDVAMSKQHAHILLQVTEFLFVSIAAVAEEKKRQREGLKKQRDQYISRSEKMKRELKELKQQKSTLAAAGHGKRSPSPKTNGFIKENEKLQVSREFLFVPKANGLSHQLVCVSLCTQSFYFCGIVQGLSVALDSKQNKRQSTTCFSFFFSGFLRKFVRKFIKSCS